MNFEESETEQRKALWISLADLMLDTDIPELWAKNIVDAMLAAQISLGQTRSIFLDEVAPVFISNLFAVAGEWEGWDGDWVIQRYPQG
jgi:hypothetical protein